MRIANEQSAILRNLSILITTKTRPNSGVEHTQLAVRSTSVVDF